MAEVPVHANEVQAADTVQVDRRQKIVDRVAVRCYVPSVFFLDPALGTPEGVLRDDIQEYQRRIQFLEAAVK